MLYIRNPTEKSCCMYQAQRTRTTQMYQVYRKSPLIQDYKFAQSANLCNTLYQRLVSLTHRRGVFNPCVKSLQGRSRNEVWVLIEPHHKYATFTSTEEYRIFIMWLSWQHFGVRYSRPIFPSYNVNNSEKDYSIFPQKMPFWHYAWKHSSTSQNLATYQQC